jgi:serine/threonine-protein kinase
MNSPITKLADGRYTVGQMIGTGGMADVYLGLDTRLDREVAIKVLRRDLAKLLLLGFEKKHWRLAA